MSTQLAFDFDPPQRWVIAEMPPHPTGEEWAVWCHRKQSGRPEYGLVIKGPADKITAHVFQTGGGRLWCAAVVGTAHRYGVDLHLWGQHDLAATLARAQTHAKMMACNARVEDITGQL